MLVAAISLADQWPLLLAGFAAGVIGGLVGIGGGVLMVPALLYVQGAGERVAVATSLAAMIPMSIVASLRQHRYGNLNLREGLLLGVLGIAGAALGATLTELLPESVLRVAFGCLMLLVAAQMLHGLWRTRRAAAADDADG